MQNLVDISAAVCFVLKLQYHNKLSQVERDKIKKKFNLKLLLLVNIIYNTIKYIAQENGYDPQLIESLIKKNVKRRKLQTNKK